MAVKKVKIIYQDETREPQIVKVLPRAQVMAEEYLKGFKFENVVVSQFYLGWAALNSLKLETLDFETWLNTIEDVEDVDETPDPTPEAPSADTSSDSAS